MRRIVGLLLALSPTACGRDDAPEAMNEAPVESPGLDPIPRDPLLARADAAFADGELAAPLVEEILASEDPAHARARRILTVMRRQARGEPMEEEVPTVSPPAGPNLGTPDPGALAEHASEGEPAPASSAAVDPPPATEPRLAVLTRLTLTRTGDTATLTVHAASALQLGVVRQADGVRLLVESAGALPAVVQARPSIDGLTVSDVRRGQDTVQIALELGEGWTPGRPAAFSGGARLKFTRR